MSECQFIVKAVPSSYWEVTFDNPPINLIDPNTIPQLNALLDKIESDPTLNVVGESIKNRVQRCWIRPAGLGKPSVIQ
jgi:hypothetical protein